MMVTTEIGTRQLADLVKEVQAGNEVLLTQGDKPIAKLISCEEIQVVKGSPLRIRSLNGHRVLTPVISQQDLADEMFNRE